MQAQKEVHLGKLTFMNCVREGSNASSGHQRSSRTRHSCMPATEEGKTSKETDKFPASNSLNNLHNYLWSVVLRLNISAR